MIDVIVSTTGELVIAHDIGELGVVSEIRINASDRMLSVVLDGGEERDIGRLQPSMMTQADALTRASVVALDGWNSQAPYECAIRMTGS
jgi:hypothetical protein